MKNHRVILKVNTASKFEINMLYSIPIEKGFLFVEDLSN